MSKSNGHAKPGKPLTDSQRIFVMSKQIDQLGATCEFLLERVQLLMEQQAELMLRNYFTMRVITLRQKKKVLTLSGQPEFEQATLEQIFFRDRDQILAARMKELQEAQARAAEEAKAHGEGVSETPSEPPDEGRQGEIYHGDGGSKGDANVSAFTGRGDGSLPTGKPSTH